MKPERPRSHATALTDDELVLFDFLWEHDSPIWSLTREYLPTLSNRPDTHSIPDDQLEEAMLRLVERGLMRIYSHVGQLGRSFRPRFVGLTELGGAAWEAERNPDWSKFVSDGYWYEGQLDSSLVVSSPSEEIALKLLDSFIAAGVWTVGNAEPVHWIEEGCMLLLWKKFDLVHHFEVSSFEYCAQTNWSLYEERRFWWRTTTELLNLPS